MVVKENLDEHEANNTPLYDRNERTVSSFKNDIIGNTVDLISKMYQGSRGVRKYSSHISSSSHTITDDENVLVGCFELPTNVWLQIFSYLDVSSLCKVARVCPPWNNLANDNLLWENKLNNDSYHWERIDHLSHPRLHKETNVDLTPKEIYLKCCPECRYLRKSIQFPTHLPKLSYFFGFSTPRIVMFGSGMDSSGLVRRVLWDQRSPFTVKGMFPGQFEGTGSGVTLQYTEGTIDLICLYALSRAERINQDLNGERKSRLLVNNEVSHSIKELCSTVDAFIYIVNATNEHRVTFGSEEFKALIDDRWLQPKVPVLVLCVVPNATVQSVSSLDVANKLNLLKLSRPWQVRQCHVNSLYGFTPGVTWLNKHIMGL